MRSAIFEACAKCGGILGPMREIVDGQPWHPRCVRELQRDKSGARIAALEAALKPFADAVYYDNGDVTLTPPDVGAYMRAKRVLQT